MKGIIVVNAFDCGKNVMYKANRMSDSFSRRGVQTKIVPNDRFLAVVGEGGKVGLTTDAGLCRLSRQGQVRAVPS